MPVKGFHAASDNMTRGKYGVSDAMTYEAQNIRRVLQIKVVHRDYAEFVILDRDSGKELRRIRLPR